MNTRSSRYCRWLLLAFTLVLCAPRRAAAQANANLVTTLPLGTVGSTPSYDWQKDNVVGLLQENTLTFLNGQPAVKVTCPSGALGIDCYALKLATGAPSFAFEYQDAHGVEQQGTVPVTLAPAPPAPAPPAPAPPAGPNLPIPRGCGDKRPATALEYGYREAVIRSGLKDHDCDEPATIYEQKQDLAILLFDETGTPIGPLPRIDEDDRVFIVVAANQNPNALVKDLRVVTCDEPQQVRVGGSAKPPSSFSPADAAQPNPPVLADPNLYFKLASATGCSSDSGIKASLTVTDDADKTTSSTISVPTLSLYRLTVGLGIVYDVSKETEFRAESVKGESVPEIVQDNHTRGLETLALVSLRLERVDNVRGRIPERPFSWLSPTIGISLANPLDHIYAGLLVDPVPGLGLVAGMHFRREPTLAGGFQVGDRVPGGQVATDKRWQDVDFKRDYFIGLDLDAVVLANILKGLAQ